MSRSAHHRLCAALLRYAPSLTLLEARERPWASVTFSGARHWLLLRVPRDQADRIARDLPEAELPIVGHIVADLAILQQTPEAASVLMSIEALTVEAG